MVILGQTPDCACFTQLKSLDKPLNHGPRFGYVAPANDALFSCARPKACDSPLWYRELIGLVPITGTTEINHLIY